ncbi:MAG TPA: sulfate ABC transporter permease subunit CysT [Thermoanaerobaculia bacterium]
MSAARPRRAGVIDRRPWGLWGLRGAVLTYLGLMIVVPLAAVIERGFSGGLRAFSRELSNPVAFDALKLTVVAAAITAAVNLVLGTLTAWVLARYRFPGRGVLDSLVDMPFAIPTLVTGVMLVVLYGPTGILGGPLQSRGISVIFARPGIVLALLFVTYPFVIRAVQPVLLEAERYEEEAAFTLGASKWTNFRRIVLPAILPAAVSGALLTFARALGEFGSIVVVAGNIPRRTLTAPVYVYGEVEAHNERGASAMSVVLLALSFGLLLLLDWRQRRRAEVLGG